MFRTQLMAARDGTITEFMQIIADKEYVSAEFIRQRTAEGRLVIPANKNHVGLIPMGIGRGLNVKINANIGNSQLSSDASCELEKLECALHHGADTVMDLSTGSNVTGIREQIIKASPVPIGTVPIYQALTEVDDPMDLTIELLLDVIQQQAEQGVDYITVHAGLLREQIPDARKRLTGIVSRGGSILAKWMATHKKENPIYVHFDRMLDICRQHDVTLSLGDGMRPGCLADASDAAQFAELTVLGELVKRSREAGVQAMVEGPGHIPLDEIEMNMKREQELCDDAPFYILGPVVTDCAPGYDHITSAIGATLGAFYGASMLCYVTPKEHLGLPNSHDVREGIIAYKIAAHAADIALKRPHARDRDDAISRARAAFDWDAQFQLALDPEKACALREEAVREMHTESDMPKPDLQEQNHYCTMCGPKFCSMRISREIEEDDS